MFVCCYLLGPLAKTKSKYHLLHQTESRERERKKRKELFSLGERRAEFGLDVFMRVFGGFGVDEMFFWRNCDVFWEFETRLDRKLDETILGNLVN